MTFAGVGMPLDGGTLPEAGIVELVELFRVVGRVELALVVVVMFSDCVFVVFWGSTVRVVVELVI